MGFLSQMIAPWMIDLMMGAKQLGELRQELLHGLQGVTLEIGAGTGHNFPYYPPSVKKLTTIDANPRMRSRAIRRAKKCGLKVDFKVLNSEKLPFKDQSFDNVVSAFTLCSIENVDKALREVNRVLKVGGKFYFLEHGLSEDIGVVRWQHRLTPINKKVVDGCHLDRDIANLVNNVFDGSIKYRTFYYKKAPKTHGYMYLGVAEKADQELKWLMERRSS